MELNHKDKDEKKQMINLSSGFFVNVPQNIIPNFKEEYNRDWVKYGENNLFPQELIVLFNKSGAHNAIIESKVRMMCGDGFYQESEEEDKTSIRTEDFINHPNPSESLEDIMYKLSLDFELYGLSYIEVIWSKDKKSISEIYHCDASYVRWGKLNDKNQLEKFYYSRDWSDYRKQIYSPVEIPIFSEKSRGGRQLLPIIRFSPGQQYYTLPDYIGALNWIKIDTEISNFHMSNLKNGMAPSLFIGFPNGQATEEERNMIDAKIQEKYSGTSNAGRYILAFYDQSAQNKPEVTVIASSDLDKQYDLLNKTTLQQIIVGHKVVNENLVGISTPSKLGSANEVIQNYQLYFNTVVKPEQNRILNAINKIFSINGYNEVCIEQNTPVSIEFSENTMTTILTQDEMREIIGYEPIEMTGTTTPTVESGVTMRYDLAGMRRIDKSNYQDATEEDLNSLYMWRTGSQEGVCPSCSKWNGQIRTLSDWIGTAIPGGRVGSDMAGQTLSGEFNPYNTLCEDSCRCSLMKIGREPQDTTTPSKKKKVIKPTKKTKKR